LAPALAVANVERDLLALLHFLLAGPLEDGRMQEHVLPTIIRRHEAEAAHLVEPLDRAVDSIGRPTLVTAAAVAAWTTISAAEAAARTVTTAKATTWPVATTKTTTRRTAEIATRRTIAEATTRALAKAATRRTTEITARRSVAEATTRGCPKVAARRTIAEAAARRGAEITPRRAITKATAARLRPVTKITARRTIPKPTRPVAETGTVTGGGGSASRSELPFDDACNKTSALTVRSNFADELVAGFRRLDSRLGQRRGVEKYVLAIWPEDKPEALAAVIPLDFRFNGRSATLIILGKHVLSYPYPNASPDGMLGRNCEDRH
jgi:hypothetical protein